MNRDRLRLGQKAVWFDARSVTERTAQCGTWARRAPGVIKVSIGTLQRTSGANLRRDHDGPAVRRRVWECLDNTSRLQCSGLLFPDCPRRRSTFSQLVERISFSLANGQGYWLITMRRRGQPLSRSRLDQSGSRQPNTRRCPAYSLFGSGARRH